MNGDYLYIIDHRGDSKSAVIYWKLLQSGRHGVCVNNLGAGTGGTCNKNFPEGDAISIQVGVWDGSSSPKTLSALKLTKFDCWWKVSNGAVHGAPCSIF
ncbi:hypothetical protein ABZ403_23355 [Micromonospora zamorensis]|uniref:hypothetical protein n=1 Tax=Micromonospora zamorensis TaxID=709883 RepID=UPI0033E595E2